MWCVAELDEEYIARMEDVLALYEKPLSEKEPVVCLDEKPVVLHADIRPSLPARPGYLARRDYEYERCGTANVFCCVEPKAGRHFPKATATRSAAEFADHLVEIIAQYPRARTIHLVLDNLNTHCRKALTDRYGEKLGSLLWARFTVQLHTHTRQLAQPGGDRSWPVQPTVPGKTPNLQPEYIAR
jgi:DDE superfamily endonuclease